MRTGSDRHQPEKRPSHLTYSAFCLAPRDRTSGFLEWFSAAKSAHYLCPVKQKRALLESNPPRDNWIERRRNKTVSTFGEAKTSPKAISETFILEPEHAFQNSSNTVSKSLKSFRNGHWQTKTLEKTTLAGTRFFEASPNGLRGGEGINDVDGRGEQHGVSAQARFVGQGGRQVRFPEANTP